MNAQKSVLKTMYAYTTSRSQSPEFTRRCRSLITLIKDVSINILPVLNFKDARFGGFVAENYSAVTMILPWLSRILEEDGMKLGKQAEPPDPAVKPYTKWNGKECKLWLSARSIPKVNALSKLEAQLMVKRYLVGPPLDIPPIQQNLGRLMEPRLMRELPHMSQMLFSSIFATDLTGVKGRNRCTAFARSFLSLYEDIDKRLLPDRDKPIWLAKFNMLGLLRAPDHFVRHGLIRNLHEGGLQGEGIVKVLRKLCPTGIRPGWSLNLNDAFYRMNVVDTLRSDVVVNSLFSEKDPLDLGMTEYDNRKFSRYKSISYVRLFLSKGVPLSVVIYQDGNDYILGAIISQVNKWYLIFISINRMSGWQDPEGFMYFDIEISGDEREVTNKSGLVIPGLTYHSCGILLPDLWAKDNTQPSITGKNYRYAAINGDWERYTCGGVWDRFL
jgi:hypothetical protein